MTLEINRRKFLQGLLAVGASFTLPAKATDAEIDQIWAEAQTKPWFFEVDDYGTLIDEDVSESLTWEDVFGDRVNDLTTAESLASEVDRCGPLAGFLNDKLEEEIQSLEAAVSGASALPKNEAALLQVKIDTLKEFINQYDEPWHGWIELEGDAGVGKFTEFVAEWLQEPADTSQCDSFPMSAGPQGAALVFFQSQPYELLDALGVEIVEGEHPCSSYYAAELRNGIDKANQMAEQLGLPFRFKKEAV
jgi:hypothetical protein